MKRGTWGRKSTTELTTASSRALGDAPAPSSHLKPKPLFYDRRQRGQNAVPDLLDRLKTALSDRYAIEQEIGAGGMATVYLAHEAKHDRALAIKVLRPELAVTVGADRFLREIKTTASLNHPHILPLFDSGEANGFLYYVGLRRYRRRGPGRSDPHPFGRSLGDPIRPDGSGRRRRPDHLHGYAFGYGDPVGQRLSRSGSRQRRRQGERAPKKDNGADQRSPRGAGLNRIVQFGTHFVAMLAESEIQFNRRYQSQIQHSHRYFLRS